MDGVHNRLHIYPLCGICYFPWHRHQIEGYALLPETSGKVLHDLCMTYDLHNLIKTATSFKGKPSLLDVILTNKPSLFHSSNSSECGLSDYHHIVYTLKRGRINLPKPRWIAYRSYKTYKEDAFLQDMAQAPLHVCQVFDDPEDVNWAYTKMITDVIDRHAPLKRKRRGKRPINSTFTFTFTIFLIGVVLTL